jgi:hypothetical protein
VTVAVTSTTVYQIDGVPYTGAAGLAVLVTKVAASPRVFVQGTLDRSNRVVQAAAVETGTGVFGNGQDWIIGHVVQRDNAAGQDATLTILGRSRETGSGTRTFNTQHAVQVALGTTRVLRRGSNDSLTTDHLNVGQLVLAFGDLNGTAMDATSGGVVRMLPTSVFGIAAGAPSNNELTLNVSRFDLRPTAAFNFTVGGATEATPAAYKIDVTGLSGDGIAVNSRIRAIGFVNRVGIANDADFDADTLVDRTTGGKLLLCQWTPARDDVLTQVNNAKVTLDVTNAFVKTVADGFAPVTLQNAPAPAVVPLNNLGLYAITRNGAVELHRTFSTFSASLSARIAATAAVLRVTALGTFDQTTQEFSASALSIVLQ